MHEQRHGPFPDKSKYLKKLVETISDFFDSPGDIGKILRLRVDSQDRIEGWEIDNAEFIFKNDTGLIKITERAVCDARGIFYLERFSYHFEPNSHFDLMQFRVDLDRISLHGNPDKRFTTKEHLCQPEDLKLNILKYNALVAIYIAHRYIYSENYPFNNLYADEYNQIVDSALHWRENVE